MDTLLTREPPPEIKAKLEAERVQIGRAEVAADIWVEGYRAGEVSIDRMCHEARRALIYIGVSEWERQRILGRMVDKALGGPEPKRTKGKKGYPSYLRGLAAGLVDMVQEREGLPKTRSEARKGIVDDDRTAYSWATEGLRQTGFNVAEETVLKWYSEKRKGGR